MRVRDLWCLRASGVLGNGPSGTARGDLTGRGEASGPYAPGTDRFGTGGTSWGTVNRQQLVEPSGFLRESVAAIARVGRDVARTCSRLREVSPRVSWRCSRSVRRRGALSQRLVATPATSKLRLGAYSSPRTSWRPDAPVFAFVLRSRGHPRNPTATPRTCASGSGHQRRIVHRCPTSDSHFAQTLGPGWRHSGSGLVRAETARSVAPRGYSGRVGVARPRLRSPALKEADRLGGLALGGETLHPTDRVRRAG